MARTPTLAAMGGGGCLMEPDNPLLDRWLLSLTGKPRPRVLLIPTASGDSGVVVGRFFTGMCRLPCEPQWLPLFNQSGESLKDRVMAADLVFVGGGNTANMLAIWRVHGLDKVLHEAWQAGVVMAGLSAGAICWFQGGSTDSFGPAPSPLEGLGWLPGSCCPHYDGEALRRDSYHRMIREGALAPGLGLDDGCAALFRGTERVEQVSSRPKARALWVDGEGECSLPVRYLGT